MAAIQDVREVGLEHLAISDGQVRMRGVERDIDELTASIKMHGLLEPIVICPNGSPGMFDVLMGQRRLLAHQKLGRTTIMAAVIDQPVDLPAAKVLSLTENLVRKSLDNRDVIDACTALYHKYGSARAVADETGLPYIQVLRHIKYDRLEPTLQLMVDSAEVSLNVALKAQDVADKSGDLDTHQVTEVASAFAKMTTAQQRQVLQAKQRNPQQPVDVLLKEARTDARPRQIIVTLTVEEHAALQRYAKEADLTQDRAAEELLASGLGLIAPSES